jgi:hopene-associated glycosyltransferase HpnB
MILAGLAALSLLMWLYLLLGRGFFWREPLIAESGAATPGEVPPVVAVVPARDEAAAVGRAVASLLRQDYPGEFRVILVDDRSSDGTAGIARQAAAESGAAERLTIVPGAPLQPGWTGKLWAVEQGWREAALLLPEAAFVLLTDADIEHHPENLRELVARAGRDRLDLASLMVRLHCETAAERALIPAFVFFFAKLYPFAWAADPARRSAAAAGGCMLVRREALERIGGLGAIRGALIDDCALAAAVKGSGGRIWLGLTRRTASLRRYEGAGEIWRMVARTAFTQLRHSPLLLLGTVIGMALLYLAPPVLTFAGLTFASGLATPLAAAAWLAMSLAYAPMLRFYGQSPFFAPLLPMVALVYLGATLDSARRHWQGRGGEWKGRVQQRGAT